jgi:hypothetical protein
VEKQERSYRTGKVNGNVNSHYDCATLVYSNR